MFLVGDINISAFDGIDIFVSYRNGFKEFIVYCWRGNRFMGGLNTDKGEYSVEPDSYKALGQFETRAEADSFLFEIYRAVPGINKPDPPVYKNE